VAELDVSSNHLQLLLAISHNRLVVRSCSAASKSYCFSDIFLSSGCRNTWQLVNTEQCEEKTGENNFMRFICYYHMPVIYWVHRLITNWKLLYCFKNWALEVGTTFCLAPGGMQCLCLPPVVTPLIEEISSPVHFGGNWLDTLWKYSSR